MRTLLFLMLMIGSSAAQILFQERSQEFNFSQNTYQGAAFADINNDGYQDAYLSYVFGPAHLLLNANGKSFSDMTDPSRLFKDPPTSCAAWADFNNDGLVDIYISGYTGPSRLYQNMNDVIFSDRSLNLPPEPAGKLTYTVALGDYDNDGLVDIYVVNFTEGCKDQLLHNSGNMAFTDATDQLGIAQVSNGKNRCAAWCDYDRDGDLDLYVGGQRNAFLFVNQGNGHFSPFSLNLYEACAATWVDYDQDGDFDLAVCQGYIGKITMLQNDGHGSFLQTTLASNTSVHEPYISLWEDLDNDADLDVVLLGNPTSGTGLSLCTNLGDATFTETTSDAGLAIDLHGYSTSAADVNSDGRLDLYISDANLRRSMLYINQSGQKNWIGLILVGMLGNRSGLGSIVDLYFGGRQQALLVDGTGAGSNGLSLLFGLGARTTLDSVTIHWPSGMVQTLQNITCNQVLTITENDKHDYVDFAIDQIIAPQAMVSGEPLFPGFIMKNRGIDYNGEIVASCIIDSSGINVYQNFQHIQAGAATDSMMVQFPGWTPWRPSLYQLHFTLHVVGDQVASNNKKSMSVQAAFNKDVRINKVVTPPAGALLNAPLAPAIIIENSGMNTINTFEAVCEIKDRNGTLLYRNISAVFDFKSREQRTLTFAGWTLAGENPLTVQFQLILAGDEHQSDNMASIVINRKTGVAVDDKRSPDRFQWSANYPNPFNSQTTVPLHLPADGRISVRICNSAGAIIRTWNEACAAGEKRIVWDGVDDNSRLVPSGVYLCQVIYNDREGITAHQVAIKMVLLK